MTRQAERIKLSKLLKDGLEKVADASHQKLNEVTNQMTTLTNGEVFRDKIIELALQGKEWAANLLVERVEGKAPVADKQADGGDVESRLEDVTIHHLNALAGFGQQQSAVSQPAASEDGGVGKEPASSGTGDKPARRPSRLLDLPSNRARRPKGAGGEPPMASEAAGSGPPKRAAATPA